jgi:hypothetical protein
MLLNLQAETATNMLGLLLERSQILRLSFDADHPLPLDDTRDIQDLRARADQTFTYRAGEIRAFVSDNPEAT